MKKILVSLLAFSLVLSPTYAFAGHGCNGCNVIDENVMNDSLVGTVVYYDGRRGTAQGYNVSDGTVYVTLDDGSAGWVPGTDVYTEASQQERNTTTGAVVVGGGLLLLCAIFCNSGNNSQSSDSDTSSNDDNRYRQRDDSESSSSSDSSSEDKPDNSVGCAWGDRDYNTCH